MIAFLRGRPVSAGGDFIIVEVGGVGYKVYVPSPVTGLVAEGKSEVIIHTYLHVREDAMQLFGFLHESDREIFELLIQISGIGPKLALAVLSAMPVPSFVAAVIQEQVTILTQIPGVGKKTAQRVIIELKDKVSKMGVEKDHIGRGMVTGLSDAAGDALQALVALGYNPVEATRSLSKVAGSDTVSQTPQDLVRLALKELGRF